MKKLNIKGVKTLSAKELRSIEGGTFIKRAGQWIGEKAGQVMHFLSQLDWTGSPLGY